MDKLALGFGDMLRWDPFKDFVPFQRYQGTTELAFAPDFEVKETKANIVLRADMPGVKAEDVNVELHGNQLTITGRRSREEKQEGDRYTLMERSYGSFVRAFTVPDGLDSKALEAELKDGVLTLTLPKVPEAQPQKITVRAK